MRYLVTARVKNARREALDRAIDDETLGAGSIAFPLISAGIYGWPAGDAVRQALTALDGEAASSKLAEARLVLFGAETYELATHVRAELGG